MVPVLNSRRQGVQTGTNVPVPFHFLSVQSRPAPLITVVSPVQQTGACLSLMRTPLYSPDLTREASPSGVRRAS